MRHSRSIAAALACLSLSASAQFVPDAGALMRQTEQMLKQKQQPWGISRLEPLPPAMVIHESTVVTVFRFQFKGNQRLSTDQLQLAVAPFVQRPLHSHDLQLLTDAVSEVYRQSGWLVQAYIPSQDLSGGEMTLQVIESIPPNKPTR